jgi:hypothetical protein
MKSLNLYNLVSGPFVPLNRIKYCSLMENLRPYKLYQPALILTLRPPYLMAGLNPAIRAFRCAPHGRQ